MYRKGVWKIAAALLLMLTVSGCGDGNSNTNGTLSLSASAQPNGVGVAVMTATANVTTVKPAAPGQEVNLTATQYGINLAGVQTIVETYSASAKTDSTGKAVFVPHNFVQQAFVTTLQVTATCEGLSATANDIPIPKFP